MSEHQWFICHYVDRSVVPNEKKKDKIVGSDREDAKRIFLKIKPEALVLKLRPTESP